jgi:UDP-3-O-acyl-N-acetylglucosamine deacetylase
MAEAMCGQILQGNRLSVERSYAELAGIPVDQDWTPEPPPPATRQVTIGSPVSVTGPGTFFGKASRTLNFEPTTQEGWWFARTDLPDALPIRVSVNTVWTTQRNIVLCSGSPHNYMRMVEHIIALRNGLEIDNLMIRMDSGDPPLFDRGSADLVEALDRAGRQTVDQPVKWVTVREPVTVSSPSGGILTFHPPADAQRRILDIDCGVNFKSAIGRQRLRVRVTPETFRHGAQARTNAPFLSMLFCKTIGQLFADWRNLGYTTRNILIAGRWKYFNPPRIEHQGKALEAVWHRTMMDLLAAIALIDVGRFVGRVTSYKAGHALDVQMIRLLYQKKLLVELD